MRITHFRSRAPGRGSFLSLAPGRTSTVRRLGSVALAVVALSSSLFALAVYPLAVQAGALKANVYLTQHKIPNGLTEKGLIGFANGHSAKRLQETTEEKIEERKFIAEMVTQFNQPPGDLEFHVLFYDITEGSRKFIEDMSTYIQDKKQRVYVNKIKLPRTRFKANRKMELVVTVKHTEVGSLKFIVDGEEKRNTGVVDFQ
jgi:hypothetical protein